MKAVMYVIVQVVLLFSGEYNELIKHIKDFSQGGNWTVHPDW
jgi:hypothetical protein